MSSLRIAGRTLNRQFQPRTRTIRELSCKLRKQMPTRGSGPFRTDIFESLIGSKPNADRSKAKRQRPKPLPLCNLTDRRNLESLLQLDIPESASEDRKSVV